MGNKITRLPYALAKERGLNTVGKTPREVWKMLEEEGITPDSAEPSKNPAKRESRDYHIDDIDSEEEKIEQIVKDVGCSEDEAKEISEAIIDFTGMFYPEYRDDYMKGGTTYQKERELIARYLDTAPTYDGEIFRGVKFENIDDMPAEYRDMSKGDIIEMGGLASWTSREKTAMWFAGEGDGDSFEDNIRILFNVPKTNKGVSVDHLSSTTGEEEVITPEGVQYRVKKIYEADIIYIDLEEV